MRKLVGISLLVMFTITLGLTSCNKYEEGPSFTLLTAKMRITGNWNLLNVTFNGNDYTSYFPTTKLDISKDETYTMTMTSSFGSSTEVGTWKFNSDKTQFITTDSDGDVTTFTIVKLKNDILKLKYVDGSDETIYTYEQ